MAESSKGMLQSDIPSLKETLCTQQQLLQKLYSELDVERESSAIAASEALSMILRLQGEKAAVKLEAEQYKRLAEEKMCHAEESLAIFEDLIYQKEMEIAALYYQVQAFRYRLLSMGCVDSGVGEIKFPENLLQRNENISVDINLQRIARRNSAPSVPLKYPYQKKGTTERERSSSPEAYITEKIVEEQTGQGIRDDQNMDLEKKPANTVVEDTNSYWEQIRKLDERVKEIAGANYANLRSESRSASPLSQVRSDISYDSAKGTAMNEEEQIKHPEYLVENERATDSGHSSSVYDIFEVPQTHDDHKLGVQKVKEQHMLQGNKRIEKPDLITQEAVKSYAKDETHRMKKMLLSTCHESNSCKQSEGVSVESNMAIVTRTNAAAEPQAKTLQLNRTSEIIEVERQAARLEAVNSKEEELKLLNEIREQLNSIQSEIRSLKTKKSSKSADFALLSLQEAMLHFWI